ncbi:PAS domain-containing protein [Pararhodobacter sp. SW119]|uniref:PAS domain-containing protein n=1 Tax=Pararhodobacter sp. SW119 TaxID=2780075 RepID=UPI001AE0AA18|nr:PAS domain-containing protein [Pararhodobacter sp. SW119]
MTDVTSNVASFVQEQAGRILRLPFALRAPTLEYPAVNTVQAYWDRLRVGRAMPFRSEIDPREIDTALEYTFIAEIVAPGVARLRVAGTHLNDLLGMEARGMPLSVYMTGESRGELATAIRQVSQGARAQLPLRSDAGVGKPALDGLLVLMPLRDRAGQATRILGIVETHGQIGRLPRRFRLAGPVTRLVDSPADGATDPVPRSDGRPQFTVIQGGRG